MSTILYSFSDWAIANVDSITWSAESLHLTVYERAPSFEVWGQSSSQPPWSSVENIADLNSSLGWQSADAHISHENKSPAIVTPVSTNLVGGVTEVGGSVEFHYWSDSPIFAKAFALSTGTGKVVLTFAPDMPILILGTEDEPTVIKAPSTSDEPYLFSYATSGGQTVMGVGNISVAVPSLRWEGPRAAHVWMLPQRANLVVNPSFEAGDGSGGVFGWRSNSTVTRVRGGKDSLNSAGMDGSYEGMCAKVAGSQAIKVIESKPFPVKMSEKWWSLEASVSGVGHARIGVVFIPSDYDMSRAYYASSDWIQTFSVAPVDEFGTGFNVPPVLESLPPGMTEPEVHSDEFYTIKMLVSGVEGCHEALFRIEFEGISSTDQFYVDDVMADPNEAQLPYFDGDSLMGQPKDFCWYGFPGINARHKSYSLFYSDRKAMESFLFTPNVGGNNKLWAEPSNTTSWVPEGASVLPHWDDVYVNRIHSWKDDIYMPIIDYSAKNTVLTLPT